MSLELAKKASAIQAVKTFINSKTSIIGIGSGSTITYAVEYLSLNRPTGLVACIPSSFQAQELIIKYDLPLGSLNQYPNIDVTIDGADEIDKDLNLIKGGGGCLFQEKLVSFASKKFIIIADYTKDSKVLGSQWKKGVPVEVIPMAYVMVRNKIRELGGDGVLRIGSGKAGPLVTDNGNFILDVNFGEISHPKELNLKLIVIPGVVETGLFCGMANAAVIGGADGEVKFKNA